MVSTKITKIAIAIPCYNEAATIAKVVRDFRKALPKVKIYVFDNNSTDGSAALAQRAGARVRRVFPQGKGHVLRAVFDELREDVIVLVDGDDTYPAEGVNALLAPVLSGAADMVVGERMGNASDASMKPLHQFGNRLFVAFVNRLFNVKFHDILSGYRVFNRRFIESVPVLTGGFEVETEITLQALAEGLRVVEVPINYRSRPRDSQSKLRPLADGYRIVLTAAILLRDHHPLRLFGWVASVLSILGFGAGVLRLLNYFNQSSLPDSLLSGIVLLFLPMGLIALGIGLTLNAINTRFQEIKNFLRRSR